MEITRPRKSTHGKLRVRKIWRSHLRCNGVRYVKRQIKPVIYVFTFIVCHFLAAGIPEKSLRVSLRKDVLRNF